MIFLFLTGLILAIKSFNQNFKKKSNVKLNLNLFFTLIQGFCLGIFTGLLGVGGGF